MNCHEFWREYEQSGMTEELQRHLDQCPSCRDEMHAEEILDHALPSLPELKAPEAVFDRIMDSLDRDEERENGTVIVKRPETFFRRMIPHSLPVVPTAAAVAAMLFATVWITFVATRAWLPSINNPMISEYFVPDLEDAEKTYLKALDKYMAEIEESKDQLNPELYDIYREKLAVLDEYILECREAVDENEYNGNARRYLAMAYIEKARTLKEIAHSLKG